MASCISCGERGVVDKVLSTWNFKSEPDDETINSNNQPEEILVDEALSVIFELSPLTSKAASFAETEENVKLFQNSGNLMCLSCGESLASLYNAWKGFISLIKLESEIWNKLTELENGRKSYHEHEFKDESTSTKNKRPKKNQLPKFKPKIDEEMGFDLFDESDSDNSEMIRRVCSSSEDDLSAPDSPIDMGMMIE